MRTSAPATRKARDFLENTINQARAEGVFRLPTIDICAQQAGTARYTMWKALNSLRQEGVVTLAPGRGIEITGTSEGSAPRTKPVIPRSYTTWESVLREFETRILDRSYSSGLLLPSIKELQRDFGCSYATMKKVLQALLDKGFIRRETGGFRPVGFSQHSSQSCICLIARARFSGTLLHWTLKQSYRLLESRCARLNIRLVTIPCYFVNAKPVSFLERPDLIRLRTGGLPVLGYALWTCGLKGRFDIAEMVRALEKTGKSVAVVNDKSGMEDVLRFPGGRGIYCRRFYANDSLTSGNEVGNFLLRKGHRAIAVFSHYDLKRTGWAGERVDGLLQACTSAGNRVAYSVHQLENTVEDIMHFDLGEDVPVTIDKKVVMLRKGRDFCHRYSSSFVKAKSSIVVSHAIRRQLIPLLQSMLENERPTAVVGINDTMAIECRDCLDQCRPRHKISVVGFDDTQEALEIGFSSYNYNVESLIEHILSFCLNPHKYNSATACGGVVTEIAGFIMEREHPQSYRWTP
jgi:DNA-binding transcriptional regulator YhcF (GntR family)